MQWVGAGGSDLGYIKTKLGIKESYRKIARICAKGGDKKAFVTYV
jgi:hypothetical protein